MPKVILREWWTDPAEMTERAIPFGDYLGGIDWVNLWRGTIHRWDGEDREGKPLHVAWVTRTPGANGHMFPDETLHAYEVQDFDSCDHCYHSGGHHVQCPRF